MAIKPIDEIPLNTLDKRKSQRENIRMDILEAIEKGVSKFEFDGDYNWKYLAQYAREEADQIWRKKYHEITVEARQKYGLERMLSTYPDYKYKGEYIRIHTNKMADRIHVYCVIDFEAPERITKPIIEQAIAEQKETDGKIQAKDPGTKIIDLPESVISLQTRNVLLCGGFGTVGDLKGKTREEIVKIRNSGEKTADETMALMELFNL